MICPSDNCKECISPFIIENVVSRELYDKYLKFRNYSLEGLNDNEVFVRCPTVSFKFYEYFIVINRQIVL